MGMNPFIFNPSVFLSDTAVTAKLLTGYVSGAGTVAATDSVLQAIQKLNGNQVAVPAGVTDGSNAAAGKIGEYKSSTVLSGAPVAVTTATVTNVTSLVLPAGDWDVEANAFLNDSATTLTSAASGLVTAAGTFPDSSAVAQWGTTGNTTAFINAFGSPVPKLRVSSNGNTTVYLQVYSTFASGTVTACGQIQARRVR